MKVLMFGWEFPPYISGGLGTACKGLTKHITQQGVNVLFVMPKIIGEIPAVHRMEMRAAKDIQVSLSYETFNQDLSEETVKFLEVDSLLQPYQDDYAYQKKLTEEIDKIRLKDSNESYSGTLEFSGMYGENLLAEVSRFALVGAQLAQNETFDIIHAHDWMTYLAAIEAKRSSGKPLIVHIHATEYDRSGDAINNDIVNLERLGFEKADRVIRVTVENGKVSFKSVPLTGFEFFSRDTRKPLPLEHFGMDFWRKLFAAR
jgi:glycogen(starch) synthase